MILQQRKERKKVLYSGMAIAVCGIFIRELGRERFETVPYRSSELRKFSERPAYRQAGELITPN
jgi:hypothetical protein